MRDYFKDSRGEIRKFEVSGAKFNVLCTKKGALRSGDYHKTAQYDLILKGRFRITLRKGNRNVSFVKGPNTLIKIPPKTPHLFKSLTNSIMLEWWDGSFEAKYYMPYRTLVENSIKNRKNKR